jgi:hypothetical protein
MKNKFTNRLGMLMGVVLGTLLVMGIARAQQPSPSPTPKKTTTTAQPPAPEPGEDAGNYTIISTIEVGARGLRVVGDDNKYRSDLNYHAGIRLFDSSFLMRAKDGKGGLFDTLLVTSSGWGADPNGNMRINVEKPKWYRFEGTYRRFKYFRLLNNFANPNYIFSPASFSVPPRPTTGYHGYNTRTELGDFELTILPKNDTIRFNVGYSPERYNGPFFTTYHIGGNEFFFPAQLKSRGNDFRVGAEGKVGPIDFSFLQGFRRFRDDSFINVGAIPGISLSPAVASFTSFIRQEPTRGSINFTRLSIHSLVAKKLDFTARVVHSSATSNSTFLENMTGTNFNTRITGQLAPPNVLLLGQYNIPSTAKRPNTLADLGVTFLATSKFRISNTFRVEDFTIDGVATFNDIFSVQRGTTINTRSFTNLGVSKTTKYRKYQDTVEGDYQFNAHYSVHFGYRYGSRRDEQILTGYALNSNAPTLLTPTDDLEKNHTDAFFGGFKAHPVKNWTLYFDAEHGTADNVFTRIGNYNYTNIRAKSRYAPTRKVNFNLALITKDNSNPSEIAGVSVSDFGVNTKSRIFTSSVDWTANSRVQFSMGYNYNWVNSDAVIDYFYQVPPAVTTFHHFGHALYFQRNNFFFIDATSRLARRVTLYTSYRINKDNGQGNRLADPTGGTFVSSGTFTTVLGGTLITSYPMSFQSPEARLALRLNRHLDWNFGYQYYNYNESKFPATFPGSPRPQNYHAHQPYISLRLYIGRKE